MYSNPEMWALREKLRREFYLRNANLLPEIKPEPVSRDVFKPRGLTFEQERELRHRIRTRTPRTRTAFAPVEEKVVNEQQRN